MEYRRTVSGAVQSEAQAAGLSVIFQAANVRKEHTGIHALVTIAFARTGRIYPCKEDNFNVGRMPDRDRLVKAIYAHKEFAAIFEAAEYTQTQMAMDLMAFARGLWDFSLGQQEPTRRAGAIERTAPDFLIRPFAINGAGTIAFGPPGAGKSWIGYIWAVCVDAGIDRYWPVRQAPAMIVNLERGESSVDARMGDVNAALHLPRDRELLRLDRRGAAFTDIADAVARVVKREGIGLVVVDSLSRMGLGKMVDDDVANRGMDALNRLGTSWIVLAHTPRADSTHTYGCHSEDTEVLTRRGWLPHQLLTETDDVAAYDMGTETLRWERPLALHEYDYSGDLLALGGQSQRMLVTPTHRMAVQHKSRAGVDGQWGAWRFTNADALPLNARVPYATPFENTREDCSEIAIGEARFPADDFLRFLGWWVSEGSLNGWAPTLTQHAGPLADAMAECLDSLGLPYRTAVQVPKQGQRGTATIHHHRVSGASWLGRWLAENAGRGAGAKRLPDLVWGLSTRQQEVVLSALMDGDGWRDARAIGQRRGGAGGAMHYSTASVQLADDVQRLAIELGMSGYVRPLGRAKPHHLDRYSVLIGHRRYVGLNAWHITKTPYTGRVYCLTVPSGAYLTRRDGAMAISGNSQMFDAAADLTVQILSDDKTKRGTLGLGLKLDKRNDVAPIRDPFQIALEFDDMGLTRIRRAMPGEFIEIDSARKQTAAEMVRDYMRREGATDAGTIAEGVGLSRGTVATILGGSEYRRVGKQDRKVLYGLADTIHNEVSDNVSSDTSQQQQDRRPQQHEVLRLPPSQEPTPDSSSSEAKEWPF